MRRSFLKSSNNLIRKFYFGKREVKGFASAYYENKMHKHTEHSDVIDTESRNIFRRNSTGLQVFNVGQNIYVKIFISAFYVPHIRI